MFHFYILVYYLYDKSKHYTPVEYSFLLHIIDNYKHVIECKRSNVNSLRDKELAKTKICDEFNKSSLTVQEVRSTEIR